MYGKLDPKTFMARKNALKPFQSYISLSVDIIFDPIDVLAELAEVSQ